MRVPHRVLLERMDFVPRGGTGYLASREDRHALMMSEMACLQHLLTTWHNEVAPVVMTARMIDGAISQAWLEAAKDLGIRVVAPFTVQADEPIAYEAHLLDFGGPKGTVVGVLSDKLDDCRATQGFYSSNLSLSYRRYERQHFINTLNDWGWYGPEELRPVWYTGESWT